MKTETIGDILRQEWPRILGCAAIAIVGILIFLGLWLGLPVAP